MSEQPYDEADLAWARVTTCQELHGVLTEAFQGDEPLLIEVPVGDFPSPWPLIHER